MNDDIALLVADIKRWAGQDARILEAVEQLVKVYEAEVDALAFEAMSLDRAIAIQDAHKAKWDAEYAAKVRATTLSEQRRIELQAPTWAHRVENWRGDDFFEGAAPEDRSAM